MKRLVIIFATAALALYVSGCATARQSVSAPTTLPTALSGEQYGTEGDAWLAAHNAALRNAAMEKFGKDMRDVTAEMRNSGR